MECRQFRFALFIFRSGKCLQRNSLLKSAKQAEQIEAILPGEQIGFEDNFACQEFFFCNLPTPGFKGIVSLDFEGLQLILINRLCVPDVPLEVNSF